MSLPEEGLLQPQIQQGVARVEEKILQEWEFGLTECAVLGKGDGGLDYGAVISP